jgi:hypothetical protein
MSEVRSVEYDALPRLECTACPAEGKAICYAFEEQDDGEGRVDTYCFTCGHSKDCHEPLPDEAFGKGNTTNHDGTDI